MSFTGCLYHLGYPALRLYWFVFRPETSGVRNLIRYKNKYLFIRNTYNSKWNIPGGGIKYRETPKTACLRETDEETGLSVTNVRFVGKYISTDDYKSDHVYCYCSDSTSADVKIQSSEILDYAWLPLNKVPSNRNSGVDIIIRLSKEK